MAHVKTPLAAALGAAFLVSAIAPLASAEANPFSAQQLSGGYDLASYAHHEEGEGEEKAEGEGKCGDKKAEGKCGDKKAEGKCGEGKCGGDKAESGEGKCGDDKADSAEGKCGGDK